MKAFLVILFLSGYFIVSAQTDNYKPYLVENNKIAGANTAAKNKKLGETDVDTIFYVIELIDSTVGLFYANGRDTFYYRPILVTNGYGLWVNDNYLGWHWDLFDRHFVLFSSKKKILIIKIIEVSAK